MIIHQLVGPRQNAPKIEVQISDLQGTIDSAMGTVIDEHNRMDNNDDYIMNNYIDNNNNINPYGSDDEFDRGIPIPAHQSIADKSRSIESNDSNNNSRDEILTMNIIKDWGGGNDNNDDHLSNSDSDFQIVD